VRVNDIVIHETDAVRIDAVLGRFLADSGCAAALLIDRSGQPLAETGVVRTLDTGSIGALAAGAFSATAALARLLGESEFSVLFHEGVRESMHVSTVDDETILLAIFDERTTVGMVRLFAREASTSIGGILEETRKRPKRVGALAAPLTAEEMRRASDHRSA
jgi:predicted regulator of Ras-like GTPase activity (Roadblock/LC7/MglB family)